VAVDAYAGQVTPSHDFRLGERRAGEGRKENNRTSSPNH
jgi:hypothetical protein